MTEQEITNLSTFNHSNFQKLLKLVKDHADIISTEVVSDAEAAELIADPDDLFYEITEGSDI